MENIDTSFSWVFGYGSLLWKPGFQHGDIEIGYIEGFSRRFWQGNETHRGRPGRPGRVATLVEDQGERTYGIAMEMGGDLALDYLNNRESKLGGYSQEVTNFYVLNSSKPPIPVLVYLANNLSPSWLGPADPDEIAEQVMASEGPAGHNVEYVIRLAMWVHQVLPTITDKHLFDIEDMILVKIRERGKKLSDYMEVNKSYINGAEFRELNSLGVTVNIARGPLEEYTCSYRKQKCIDCNIL